MKEKPGVNTKPFLPKQASSGRRSILKNGTALLGACLFTSAFGQAGSENERAEDPDAWFNVRKFGATGNRADNATKAFQAAIGACTQNGGGTVYVPPGEYTVGTVQLMDSVTLHIDAGATLLLSQSREDFKPGARAMIFAENAKNAAVTGRGTLDGLVQYDYRDMTAMDPEIKNEIEIAREAGEEMKRYYRKSSAMSTFMFILNDCINFKLSDVSIIHSPLWNVRLNDCDRVYIRGLHIFSDLEKGIQTDGIDICSSKNVIVSDSVIVTGDDAIVLKSISRGGKKANPCENITVTNCILESSSTPLKIGTETEADIRFVNFNNCIIRNSNRGLAIIVHDGATVSSVIFSNISIETNRRHWNWWGSAEMVKIILSKRKADSRLGKIRDIFISNIIANVRGTSSITGHPDQPLENIRITDVQMFMQNEDARDKRATDAIRIEAVSGLKIRDLTVNWEEKLPENKWQSALLLKDVSEFEISSFSGRQGLKTGEAPVILLDNAKDGIIRDSCAAEGSGVFIQVAGDKTRDIILRNNNIKKAAKEIVFGNEVLKKAVEIK
jgi:polygalacturonase